MFVIRGSRFVPLLTRGVSQKIRCEAREIVIPKAPLCYSNRCRGTYAGT
jgi:hypothetical protein